MKHIDDSMLCSGALMSGSNAEFNELEWFCPCAQSHTSKVGHIDY